MTALIQAKGLCKNYSDKKVLKAISFNVERGRVVGLVGPNGAGKTTVLKAILGLTSYEGELNVLGHDPSTQRHEIMKKVSFIADVAVMPSWLKVSEALEFVTNIHPNFSLKKAEYFLSKTDIPSNAKVKELSKGMLAQLHLALVISIDAELLVLDEPTLGLDILYRKEFYNQLLSDFFNEGRSILITTHQIEEVEHLLTDLLFIRRGEIILDSSMDAVSEKYIELMVSKENVEKAEALNPMTVREAFGRKIYLYQDIDKNELESLGEINSPSVADLFVALMTEKK